MSWNWSQEKAKYFCWPRTAKIMGEFFFSHSFLSCSQCWCLTGFRLIFRILSFQLSILDRHILVASQKGWLPKLQTENITIQILIKIYLLKKAFCVVITQHKMNEGLFIFEGFKIPLSKSSWHILGVDDSIGYEPYLLNSPVLDVAHLDLKTSFFLFASFPLWIFSLPNLACI